MTYSPFTVISFSLWHHLGGHSITCDVTTSDYGLKWGVSCKNRSAPKEWRFLFCPANRGRRNHPPTLSPLPVMVEQDHFSTQCGLVVQEPLGAASKTHQSSVVSSGGARLAREMDQTLQSCDPKPHCCSSVSLSQCWGGTNTEICLERDNQDFQKCLTYRDICELQLNFPTMINVWCALVKKHWTSGRKLLQGERFELAG